MILPLIIINLFILSIYSKNIDNNCNTLLSVVDKIIIKSQNYKTKTALDNLYKRRSRKSGISINKIKNCYKSTFKKPTFKKS
jgi:hypothetical protein